jgi:hypothetical protein
MVVGCRLLVVGRAGTTHPAPTVPFERLAARDASRVTGATTVLRLQTASQHAYTQAPPFSFPVVSAVHVF